LRVQYFDKDSTLSFLPYTAWLDNIASHTPTSALPVEIAFLIDYGIPIDVLRTAADQAITWGVSADEALVAAGHLSADDFYRALARHLALPFLGQHARADSAHVTRQTHESGILPLIASANGARFALAPSGSSLRRLLERRTPDFAGGAITTPQRLRQLAHAARANLIAYDAANVLPDTDPLSSIRDGASTRQIAALACLSGVVSFSAVTFPILLGTIITAIAAVLFLTMVVLRIAAAQETIVITSPRKLAYSVPDKDLPHYTVIVALYRESLILPQLINALTQLDYPPAKLDIKLVIERDDDETHDALAQLVLPPFMDVLVAPHGMPRTKPRALNVALASARGQLIAIYDAEDVPDPLQLRHAAVKFATAAADVACLQAHLVIDNTYDSWLTRLFTIEYAQLFDVINPAMARFCLPIALGGTSNHFRTDVLREVRGWDAWNVTEDADLGFRLASKGYRVEDLPSATLEEAPAHLRAWMHQRTRWLKGWMQVCITHSRHPLDKLVELGPAAFLTMVAVSFGTVATALGFPIFTALAIIAIRNGDWMGVSDPKATVASAISLTIFAAGLVAIIMPAIIAIRRRRLFRLLPWLLLLPVYYALMSLAAWRAVWELMRAPFHWNKTTHGLARTTRTGALTALAHDKASTREPDAPPV
jgi:glycosyltransferase XagB